MSCEKQCQHGGPFKDGAYYCYCAYVLRVSRYSDFLSVMLTDTVIIIFAQFKTIRRNYILVKVLLVSKKKIGGNHAFLRDN